jgi:hypothetical protein
VKKAAPDKNSDPFHRPFAHWCGEGLLWMAAIMNLNQMKALDMKRRYAIALAASVLALTACIPSLHSFYLEKDVVFEQRLVGEWLEKDTQGKPQTWRFEKGDDNAYRLLITEGDGKKGEFDTHLFKLKEELFLDLTPREVNFATNQSDLVAMCLIEGHMLVRVPQLEPCLQLAFIDSDWLEKYLGENPKSLAHCKDQKRLVLTAPTAELQDFVLRHLEEGELFQKPGEMVKKAAELK